MKNNNYPLVSIIIPTYKRANFLGRAIESAINQTYPSIEVLVIDDNDPNTTFREQTQLFMETYHEHPKVRYIKHPHNMNGAKARNTGIEYACGEYVCFLDDDDWFMPDKISLQMDYLLTHPEYNAVYCGFERASVKKQPYKTGNLSFELLSGVEIIYTNTILMKRSCAIACGGWDDRFKRNQEAVFLLRYFRMGEKIGVIPNILVGFDVSDASNRSKPKQFEEDFHMFLELHQPEIKQCQNRYPDAREMIYSYRYRGVLLNYLKYGYITEAVCLFKRMNRLLPKRFCKDCFVYVKRRLLKQPLFLEFERR